MVGTGPRRLRRGCALLACAGVWIGIAHGCTPREPLAAAGRKEYQALGWVPVPHGLVNMIGGNLLIERRDLDLDTQIGRLDLGAAWNSATRDWIWSFEPTFDGTEFRDASGATHDVTGLASEAAIPGTHWVYVDARTVRTKGGLVHEFDAAGRLSVVRWRSATWPQLRYVGAVVAGGVRTVEIRQYETASSSRTMATIERDSMGRVSAVEDRTGRRAEYARNAAGQLVAARDALDLAEGWPGIRYEYGVHGHVEAITDSEGVRTEYAALSLRTTLVRRVGPGNPTWSFSYTKAAGISESVLEDPLGGMRTWRYDDRRRVLELENEAGERTSLTWRGLRPVTSTTPAGVTTGYWVVDDELAGIWEPSGNLVGFVWAAGAENRADPARPALAQLRDGLGIRETRTYDAQGRLATRTNGAGETWTFEWNGRGLLSERTDPAGSTTHYRDYGAHGHPREIEFAGGTVALVWDGVGNLESAGMGAGSGPGGVIERRYDADRNLSRLVLADLDGIDSSTSRNLDLSYRSDGRPLRIDRPYGADTEWTYDAFGRVVSRRDLADGYWRTTRWEYDGLGRTLAHERANGTRTEWSRDPVGRPIRIAHVRADGAEHSHVLFDWQEGRLAAVDESEFPRETLAYDGAGRLERVVEGLWNARVLGYDLRSRIVSERYEIAGVGTLALVEVEYDAADREVELRRGSTWLRRRTFADGRLTAEAFASGVVRTNEYDPTDGLLGEIELRSADGSLLARESLARTELAAGSGALLWDVAATTRGPLSGDTEEHYLLAPLAPGEPGARIADFASDGTGVTHAWDELSNLVSRGDPGGPGRRTYAYDAQRTRLLRVRSGSGALLHSYAYDAAGFATARDGEPITWDAGGRPTAYDGQSWEWDTLGRLRTESDEAGTRPRIFGGRVVASPLGLDLGSVVLDLGAAGNDRFRHLDFRGNVKWVTDASGSIVARFAYGPHRVLEGEGATARERSFAQGVPAGALLRLGHRLYDPAVGRFLAPDPVYQVVNAYGYTLGDPIHFWDPSGREVSAQTVAQGVASGAAIIGFVGLASALSLGAPVVVTTYFAVGAFGSAGVYTGLLVPYSLQNMAVSGAVAAILNYPAGAPFAGFVAGQTLQNALADTSVPRGKTEPPARPTNPEPEIGKTLELRIADFEPGAGCSPTRLAGSTPRVPAPILYAAAGVQLTAAIWVARRARRRGDDE